MSHICRRRSSLSAPTSISSIRTSRDVEAISPRRAGADLPPLKDNNNAASEQRRAAYCHLVDTVSQCKYIKRHAVICRTVTHLVLLYMQFWHQTGAAWYDTNKLSSVCYTVHHTIVLEVGGTRQTDRRTRSKTGSNWAMRNAASYRGLRHSNPQRLTNVWSRVLLQCDEKYRVFR